MPFHTFHLLQGEGQPPGRLSRHGHRYRGGRWRPPGSAGGRHRRQPERGLLDRLPPRPTGYSWSSSTPTAAWLTRSVPCWPGRPGSAVGCTSCATWSRAWPRG